jgi:hypothetical protein
MLDMEKEIKKLLLLVYEKGVRQEQVDLDELVEKIKELNKCI